MTDHKQAMQAGLSDEQIDAVARELFCKGMGEKEGDWGPNTLNQQWCESIGRPFARAILAASSAQKEPGETGMDERKTDGMPGMDGGQSNVG
jgi:hypothetical protein